MKVRTSLFLSQRRLQTQMIRLVAPRLVPESRPLRSAPPPRPVLPLTFKLGQVWVGSAR